MPTQPEVSVDFTKFHLKISRMNEVIRERLKDGVKEAAELVADTARELAPRHIGDFIQIEELPISEATGIKGFFGKLVGGNVAVGFRVFVKLSDAPDARAWEYGSGLHATKGSQDYIPILAKNVPNLVFFWEREGRMFVGPFVSHPGITARPYLHPALDQHRDEIKSIIQESIRNLGRDL